MILMNSYVVAAYIRLSKEDYKNLESESVINQRNLIKEFLDYKGLAINYEYVDDGYSGTSFDRPAFNRLICDIENGKINMVVTKDLSRLGRNYIKTGYYIEEYFPLKKIRYVSILDNIDTHFNDNDIAPFKALFNDMVAKDTSRKIKSILESKKKQGKYLAALAPFGYKKDINNKYKLVIDEDSAIIVRKIFRLYLKGYSINEIANYLNIRGIDSPSKYKNKGDNLWSYSSIYNILKNKIYIGITVQNVWTNISYKNKTRIKRDKDDWIINNFAHEAIIGKRNFYDVQKKLHKKDVSAITNRPKLLLEGLLYCKECGRSLGVNCDKKRHNYYLICNGYKKNTKKCTSHYICYDNVEKLVLEKINKHVCKFNYKINNEKRIQKIRNKINVLYNDRLNGIISLDVFIKKKSAFEQKILELNKERNLCINREMLFLLVDGIYIDKEKNVFLKYKFKKPD